MPPNKRDQSTSTNDTGTSTSSWVPEQYSRPGSWDDTRAKIKARHSELFDSHLVAKGYGMRDYEIIYNGSTTRVWSIKAVDASKTAPKSHVVVVTSVDPCHSASTELSPYWTGWVCSDKIPPRCDRAPFLPDGSSAGVVIAAPTKEEMRAMTQNEVNRRWSRWGRGEFVTIPSTVGLATPAPTVQTSVQSLVRGEKATQALASARAQHIDLYREQLKGSFSNVYVDPLSTNSEHKTYVSPHHRQPQNGALFEVTTNMPLEFGPGASGRETQFSTHWDWIEDDDLVCHRSFVHPMPL